MMRTQHVQHPARIIAINPLRLLQMSRWRAAIQQRMAYRKRIVDETERNAMACYKVS